MGKVYLVGAGPGDPDLITVKGLKCIQQADVILYDRLLDERLLSFAKKDAFQFFVGKNPGKHHVQQTTINHLLVKYAREGKTVARLKGGDPFIFGRGGEEAQTLVQAGISFEIIPGITSGAAVPAYAGIPLTHREFSSSVTFISGHLKEGSKQENDWAAIANGAETLVIYMGVKRLHDLCETLQYHGKSPDTPVAIIQSGTTTQQKTVTGTLANLANRAKEQHVQNPAIILVGEVVKLREQLQWFEQNAFHAIENQFLEASPN